MRVRTAYLERINSMLKQVNPAKVRLDHAKIFPKLRDRIKAERALPVDGKVIKKLPLIDKDLKVVWAELKTVEEEDLPLFDYWHMTDVNYATPKQEHEQWAEREIPSQIRDNIFDQVVIVKTLLPERIETYAILTTPYDRVYRVENAPWNQGPKREIFGASSAVRELVLETIFLNEPDFMAQESIVVSFWRNISDDTFRQYGRIFMENRIFDQNRDKRPEKCKNPTPQKVINALLHLKILGQLNQKASSPLEIAENLGLPVEAINHILFKMAGFYAQPPFF